MSVKVKVTFLVQAARQRRRGSTLSKSNASLATADSEASTAAGDKQAGQGAGKQAKVKGNWLKSRLFNKSGSSLKGMEAEDSDVTSRASSSGSLHADLQWVEVRPLLQWFSG